MTVGGFISFALFGVIIPVVFAILFIVFIWGAFYYVIAGGHDEESREKGKALLMYGLIGFVLLAFVTSFFSGIAGSVPG
jgi:uncharacterized membrane protein YfcA